MNNLSFFERELSAYKTIVVANGELSSNELILSLMHTAEHIVCCDGAFDKLLKINVLPEVVVGDLDSLSEDARKQYAPILHPDESTEYNDLQKALKYCISNGYNDVLIMGASGLREDHQLANLSILNMYATQLNLKMVSQYGVFSFLKSSETLASFPGQEVSVFSLDGKAVFSFSGLKYPVKNRQFFHLWEGSLNVVLGNEFTIDIQNGQAVVYRSFEN